eukprot:bmy_14931T0
MRIGPYRIRPPAFSHKIFPSSNHIPPFPPRNCPPTAPPLSNSNNQSISPAQRITDLKKTMHHYTNHITNIFNHNIYRHRTNSILHHIRGHTNSYTHHHHSMR